MNNENDSKWSAKMLITWAILIDIGLLGCLFIMPLLKLIQDLFRLIYLLIVSRRLFSSPGFFITRRHRTEHSIHRADFATERKEFFFYCVT